MGDILAYNHATYLIPTYYSYPTIQKYVSVQELFVLSVEGRRIRHSNERFSSKTAVRIWGGGTIFFRSLDIR